MKKVLDKAKVDIEALHQKEAIGLSAKENEVFESFFNEPESTNLIHITLRQDVKALCRRSLVLMEVKDSKRAEVIKLCVQLDRLLSNG